MAGKKGKGFAAHPELINRKGRPRKKKSLTEILERMGGRRDQEDENDPGKKISRKEKLARALWSLALSGDLAAQRYIFDRIDGKPTEHLEIKDDRVEVIPAADEPGTNGEDN